MGKKENLLIGAIIAGLVGIGNIALAEEANTNAAPAPEKKAEKKHEGHKKHKGEKGSCKGKDGCKGKGSCKGEKKDEAAPTKTE